MATPASTPARRRIRWLWAIPALVLVALIGFVVWGLTPLRPNTAAMSALESRSDVTVTSTSDGWEFAPRGIEPTIALVLYSGGHVDERAYAPLAREIAGEGYLVVVPKIPLALALLDINAADKVRAAHPGIGTWVVGGHSLGGVAAASYAAGHLGNVRGLVLLASYPAGSTDLSKSNLVVLSAVGSLDAVVNRNSLTASYARLPADTEVFTIPGGNHGQFGSYGLQPGDREAGISPSEQWTITTEAIDNLLQRATTPRQESQ
ncbi:MAG: alpha/beta hydrolase [Coriobacteriia bacterium]|nr:alpha/beta hydrolase [Coriobacteriia bacterium]